MGCVDVGVAETGRLDPHADLPGVQRAARDVLDAERLSKVVHDRGPVGRDGALRARAL